MLRRNFRHVVTRSYSQRTKRLEVTFDERNDSLKVLPRSLQYPLLTQRFQRAPIERLKNVVETYEGIDHTDSPDTPELEVRGRVKKVRQASRGLIFIDLTEGGSDIQVVMNSKKLNTELDTERANIHGLIRPGDSISSVGRPWRTKAGQLSVLSTESIQMLSPSLHPLPTSTVGHTLRKHNRVAELKSFLEARSVLLAKSLIVSSITEFLQKEDFVMMSTPHLSMQKGGAAANTFDTKLLDGRDLHLRVAPELWLKRLIVGGFDRVFEIGYSYRNEGIDATHNPEFTTCEFYMSFADLPVLMDLTKRMLHFVADRVVEKFPQYEDNCRVLKMPWKVIDFVDEIQKLTGKELKLDRDNLIALCRENDVQLAADDDIPKLLDNLAAHFLEPQSDTPMFLLNQPSVMAPLAKDFQRDGMLLSKRFELFIQGKEYVNAYEEENDPLVQYEKLRAQDPEVPDKTFVNALEWGLPPTGGWGLGVDRLAMLITGSERINDVLPFGDLNQVQRL